MDAQPQVASLPDSPPWSFSRALTIRSCLFFGMGMVLMGSFGNYWHMSEGVATILINSGTSVLLGSMMIHVGGASAERMAGWFSFFKAKQP